MVAGAASEATRAGGRAGAAAAESALSAAASALSAGGLERLSALLSAGLSGSTRLADSPLAVRSRAGSDGKSAGRWDASSRGRPCGGSALRISGGGAGAGVACATGGASAVGAAAVCGAVAVPVAVPVAVAPARGAFASGGAWRSASGDPNIRCTANKIAAAVPATEAIGQPFRQSRNARTQAGAAAART
ncbi:MAG: hypothetical protein IPM01_17310 [Burkholderiaceae bacterium]|nr:hypothetical protein [Burkholderiaceae bacterium]